MIRRVIIELSVLLGIAALLMLLFHPDLLDDPLARWDRMRAQGNWMHPLAATAALYVLLAAGRYVAARLRRRFGKKDHPS